MAKKPESKQAFREELASSFIEILESEELSWRKGWQTLGSPYNPITGTRYKGANLIKLTLTAKKRGYGDPRWVTFNEISDKEGKYHKGETWKLKRGSEAVWIEYHYPIKKDDRKVRGWDKYHYEIDNGISEHEDFFFDTQFSMVFNASCVEGMPELVLDINEDIKIDEIVNKISKNMGVDILYDGGDKAFYMPSEDKVHLPKPEHFETQYDLNCTSFHELAHATGHPNRLVRDLKGNFGDEKYAYEELVAEMTSCLMSVNVIDEMPKEHLDNHKAYVQSWISILNEKPAMLSSAINDAKESANYMDYMAEVISKEEFLSRASASAKRALGFLNEEKVEGKISLNDNKGIKENDHIAEYNIPNNNNSNSIDNVMKALTDYYYREFDEIKVDKETADYSDIGVAYTTTPDGEHEIQYTIDLNEMKWYQFVDNQEIESGNYKDYDEIINELKSCSFDDFVRVDDKKLLDKMNLVIDENGNYMEHKENLIATKLNKEFDEYKENLKSKDKDYIIDRSFETHYKYNLVITAENMEFSQDEVDALLSTDNLLGELYNQWLEYDGVDEMEGYFDSLTNSKENILNYFKSKTVSQNKEIGDEPEL